MARLWHLKRLSFGGFSFCVYSYVLFGVIFMHLFVSCIVGECFGEGFKMVCFCMFSFGTFFEMFFA